MEVTQMKTTTVSYGICGACGAELDGSTLRFFMPVPNRVKGTTPSKRVCEECFSAFLDANAPEGVRVSTDEHDRHHDDFYGGDQP